MRGTVLALAFTLVCAAAIAGGANPSGTGSATAHMSFSKRAEIGFAEGAEEVSPVVRPEIAHVALELKSALAAADGTVELEAYAPTPESRAIAVQRAADVRLSLVEAGVPAERIDVRVVPRAAYDGVVDRVTIYLRRKNGG